MKGRRDQLAASLLLQRERRWTQHQTGGAEAGRRDGGLSATNGRSGERRGGQREGTSEKRSDGNRNGYRLGLVAQRMEGKGDSASRGIRRRIWMSEEKDAKGRGFALAGLTECQHRVLRIGGCKQRINQRYIVHFEPFPSCRPASLRRLS